MRDSVSPSLPVEIGFTPATEADEIEHFVYLSNAVERES